MKESRKIGWLTSVLFFSLTFSNVYADLKKDVKKSVDHGISYLRTQQKDGKWMNHPGVTSLCLMAKINCHRKYEYQDGPFMRTPLDYLLSLQQNDGGFYDPNSRSPTKNYSTSLAMIALSATQDKRFAQALEKAKQFLIEVQADEGEQYDKDKDYFYGGIGYGGDQRPDLSNLHMALEALRAAGLDKNHPAFKKALIFVNRCQDTEENPLEWSETSGGFAYSPDVPTNKNLPTIKKERVIRPYGSMTFAGLKSLIFCDVPPNDKRIKQALEWIKKNFSVKVHPGMKDGQISIYYYYFTLSKALDLISNENYNIDKKLVHNWNLTLANEILSRQQKDGSWVNSQKKYMEGFPVLCTAYAINSLNLIYPKL